MTHDNPDAHDDRDKRPDPGPRANQGFGAPGSPSEQRHGVDSNPPAGAAGRATADEESDMKPPAKDGLDPQKIEKAIKSDEEMIPEEQLNEDISVTGAPPKKDGPVNAPKST